MHKSRNRRNKKNAQIAYVKVDQKKVDQLNVEKKEDQLKAEKKEDQLNVEKKEDQLKAEKKEDQLKAEKKEDQLKAEKKEDQLKAEKKEDQKKTTNINDNAPCNKCINNIDDQSAYNTQIIETNTCYPVFNDRETNEHLYHTFLDLPNGSCKVIFRILINNKDYYDYTFLSDLTAEDYKKTRLYLAIIATIGISEKDNIAVVELASNKYKTISLALIYWNNVIVNSVKLTNKNNIPIITDISPETFHLVEIHAYDSTGCFERIDAEYVNQKSIQN